VRGRLPGADDPASLLPGFRVRLRPCMGLGSTIIVDGIVEPMELGYLPYKKGSYEDYVGRAGLERHGKMQWRRDVADVVARLIAALEPDDTVLGGGNVKKLKVLPPLCRAGDNANAFRGGIRLWEETTLSGTPGLVPNDGFEGSERMSQMPAQSEARRTRSMLSETSPSAITLSFILSAGQEQP
jgi:hypothetical protein